MTKIDPSSELEYVRRIQQETQKYTRDLIEENAKLRAFADLARNERLSWERHRVSCEENARRSRDLQSRVATLEVEKRQAYEALRLAEREVERYRRERMELDRQLQKIEEQGRRYLDQYVGVEQQNANLANLYVASYRLHAALDRAEVLSAIQEIIINLIGSEEFAIFERDGDTARLKLSSSFGIDEARFPDLEGSHGVLGECMRSGEIFIACDNPAHANGADLTACIPLRIGKSVIGLIAVFRLLGQKPGIADVDRELFMLLATHAATALYCAELHNARQRMLQGVA